MTPAASLACRCADPQSYCESSFSDALADPRWIAVTWGCGILRVVNRPYAATGEDEAFDMGTGALIGASTWNDAVGPGCLTPVGSNSYGGRGVSGLTADAPVLPPCSEFHRCWLRFPPPEALLDGGDGLCDKAALLGLIGDAGAAVDAGIGGG